MGAQLWRSANLYYSISPALDWRGWDAQIPSAARHQRPVKLTTISAEQSIDAARELAIVRFRHFERKLYCTPDILEAL